METSSTGNNTDATTLSTITNYPADTTEDVETRTETTLVADYSDNQGFPEQI